MQSHADNMSVDGGFDVLDYGYAAAPASAPNTPVHGERDLWCAVIAQAFMDMGAIEAPTSGRRKDVPRPQGPNCDEAMRWLLRDKKNFAFVCDLAGVNPHIIRRAAHVFYGRTHLALGAVHKPKE